MIRRLVLLTALLASPARAAALPDSRALKSHAFDPSSALPRLRPIPAWLLQMWKDADGMPYEAYAPSPSEAEATAAAFAGLPPSMRKVLAERLIGVYFVKGLKGNGITDWALDPAGQTYVYMVLNPATLAQTVSEVMTERDQTLFRGKADLRVEAGAGPGILYAVAHESAHAFDYVRGVTPYTEESHGRALKRVAEPPVGWDRWADYGKPKPESDYPLRSKLRFYGFGAPELDAAQAAELCAQLAASPFPSFYGSRSWAEDLAELFVLRHLTQDLRLPLRRVCAGKIIAPWDDPRVRRRARRLLEPLYR
jgi:hypothetical protein